MIEVSDSSLAYDAQVKARLYAEAGIPEFWLVDVRARCVRVHRGPAADGYRTIDQAGAGARLSVPGFADVQVDVDAVLPREG